jgi:hypothetical protein
MTESVATSRARRRSGGSAWRRRFAAWSALAVAACGTSSGPGDGGDADAVAQEAAADVADAADGSVACGPGTPDPGEVRCGAARCHTPSEVCCYDGAPHCTPTGGCQAPHIDCDESTDCAASGAYCCSGIAVQARDAAVVVYQATFCTTDPTACVPRPGVGNSSAEACQVDSECHGTGVTCVPQVCGPTQCIRLCGTRCP